MIFSKFSKEWPTKAYIKAPRFKLTTPKLKKIILKTGFKTEKFKKISPEVSFFKLIK